MILKGFEEHCITAYHIPSPQAHRQSRVVTPPMPAIQKRRCCVHLPDLLILDFLWT